MSSFQGHPMHTVAADASTQIAEERPAPRLAQTPDPEERELPRRPSTPPPPPSTRPGWRGRNAAELRNQAERGADALPGNSTLSGSKSGILQTEFFKTLNGILGALCDLEGLSAVSIASLERGMLLGHAAQDGLELKDVVAAGAEIVQAQRAALKSLGQVDTTEEIVMTLEHHYMLLRVSHHHPHLVIAVVLRRSSANLAMARFTFGEIASMLEA